MRLQLRRLLTLLICVVVAVWWAAGSAAQLEQPNSLAAGKVTLDGELLFELRGQVGSFTPGERAAAVSERIRQFAENRDLPVDVLKVREEKGAVAVAVGELSLVTVLPADVADPLERRATAEEYVRRIGAAVAAYREARTTVSLLQGVLLTLAATLAAVAAFLSLRWAFALLEERLGSLDLLLRIQNYELMAAEQVRATLYSMGRGLKLLLLAGILYVYVPLVLGFFPFTRQLGKSVLDSLFGTLAAAGGAIVSYLPNFLTIALVCVAAYYLVRLANTFFGQVERGNIVLPGFYPGWSLPTRRLIAFFILALALAIALPYLPGFNSPSFQGVSVFLGLLLSLSSSAAVSNVVAGIILIYTRAFEVGDRVRIGDATGDVVEKTLLVTRIRTIKNVVVSIPNSTVLANNVINYSTAVRDYGVPLILHTTITLGYDVPWPKVHAALIAAARNTPGITDEPAPFVLQTALNDYNVSYELNAYTDAPNQMAVTYSQLHQNVQDHCNEAGIEILSPGYTALRDGNHSTIPTDYLPADYQAPGFRVTSESPANGAQPPA